MKILFLLLLLSIPAFAQEPEQTGTEAVRRTESALRRLLTAQDKCLQRLRAEESAARECPELDKLIDSTPLVVLVRYEIKSELTAEEVKGLKLALLEACFLGFVHGGRVIPATRRKD